MKEDKLNKLCARLKGALELTSSKQKLTFAKDFLRDVVALILPSHTVTLAKAETDESQVAQPDDKFVANAKEFSVFVQIAEQGIAKHADELQKELLSLSRETPPASTDHLPKVDNKFFVQECEPDTSLAQVCQEQIDLQNQKLDQIAQLRDQGIQQIDEVYAHLAS